MPQHCPRCCEDCGKIYTKKARDAFAKDPGYITCTRCQKKQEFLIIPTAVLLQPGLVETTGATGLIIIASGDSHQWSLPHGHIRVNESAEMTLERVAKQVLGINLSPQNLRDFCGRSNPENQEHLSFYLHTTRLHKKSLLAKNNPHNNSQQAFLIIQTTDGISFESHLYREVAEKFFLEIWGGRL